MSPTSKSKTTELGRSVVKRLQLNATAACNSSLDSRSSLSPPRAKSDTITMATRAADPTIIPRCMVGIAAFWLGVTSCFAWTHIKLVVNEDTAQLFMDHSEQPHLSYCLKHAPKSGPVSIGGSAAAMHCANFTMDPTATKLINFEAPQPKKIDGIIGKWEVSDKFRAIDLRNCYSIPQIIEARKWSGAIEIDENGAPNISRIVTRYDGKPGNTVCMKLTIQADEACTKVFEMGYGDRAVAILNGKLLYRGSARWRSCDYRYLGTIGLFDAVYLALEQG
jgi:hypothetical protein